MRLYVIGAPGSGKSHVCAKISDALTIPWFDLNDDVLADLCDQSALETKRQWLQLPEWIFEAVFETGVWTEALECADWVVVLTTPWPIRVFRVVRRFFLRRFRHEEFRGQSNDETFSHMIHRAYTTWLYDRRLMPAIQEKIEGVATKTLYVRNNLEVLQMPMLTAYNQEAGQQ